MRSQLETILPQAETDPGSATSKAAEQATTAAIVAEGVTMRYRVPKRYREYLLSPFSSRRYTALSDFALELPEGGSLAVLGPNGSGKTTLLRLIGGLLYPTAGTIRVRGHSSVGGGRRPFCVGIVLSGERSFYWRLTGRQNLEFFGCLDNLFGKDVQRRCGRVLELVGLARAADERVSDYSTGMRQRLAIARGLLADPEVLILDEPTKSLDPVGAVELRRVIRDWLAARRATLALATHNMAEAQELATHVCVLGKGRLLAYKPMAHVREEHGDLANFYADVLQNREDLDACA
jgi:ABC-2 type transport system ATP-binding protein